MSLSQFIRRKFPKTTSTKIKKANSVTGDDTYGDGITNPYKTITKAIQSSQFPCKIYIEEIFTENITLTQAQPNITIEGTGIYQKLKEEINGYFSTSSASTSSRFTRLGLANLKIISGTTSPITLGSNDGGKHTFENVAFETTNSSLISIPTNLENGSFINFKDCDLSSWSPYSALILPDLDSTNKATLRLYNCGFVNISVGKGWTVYYHGDTVLNILSKYSTALIVDLARCFRMTAIITSQAALTALIAITNNTADGAYLINFAGPTGITGVAAGDVILKNGAIHMITMKYADAPAQVLDFTTNEVYVKNGTLWNKISTTSGTNTGDETAARIGTLISGSAPKTTPIDADSLAISDSAASNVLKQLSFTNLKAFLKTYFDTQYGSTYKSACQINKETSQGLSSRVFTKIVSFNNVVKNDNTYFNTSTSKFQPLTAGYYFISVNVMIGPNKGNVGNMAAQIYKNGSKYSVEQYIQTQQGGYNSMSRQEIVYFNGSTDYIEIFAQISIGGTLYAANFSAFYYSN